MASSQNSELLGSGLTDLNSEIATLAIADNEASIASSHDGDSEGGARLSDTYSFPPSDSSPDAPTPHGSDSDTRIQALPLRGLNLQSKPFNKRAVAWSCDAELAVAADDSVHVFLPEFPPVEDDQPAKAENEKKLDDMLREELGDETMDDDEDEDDFQLISAHPLMTGGRQQFFEGTRQFPVAYPPLNPEINRHLWDAAGLEFPVLDDAPQTARVDESADLRYNPDPYLRTGAGAGLIASVGSTMNHVVAIEWSPSGVGRNDRPVLAVLTGSGVLAIYGEGSPNISSGAKGLRSTTRDLGRWVVLWAVGENFVIPGQDNYGERIISFAWAHAITPGRAVLGYQNDQGETVFVSIRTEYKRGGSNAKKKKEEEAIWHVREVARMKIQGPHIRRDIWDPDYTPYGSAFSLRWSLWTNADEGNWRCLLSYLDYNYVGFRRVTLHNDFNSQDVPQIQVDEEDWMGICINLSPDAFVEFEPTVWVKKVQADEAPTVICRGVIATPFRVHPFEVNLIQPKEGRWKPMKSHSTTTCRTTYRKADDKSTNPIHGLVIHPQPTAGMTETPIYTLVRLSATATNNDWYETNAPWAEAPDRRPQWAVEIAQKVSVSTPAGMNPNVDDSEEDDEEGSEKGAGGGARLDDPDADLDEDETFTTAPAGPDVHPTRMRLWGLAQSPGGGSTVVLATHQLTQFPERGGWQSSRSRIMFGWTPRDHAGIEFAQPVDEASAFRLTTEGKVWEWMYGFGPGIPGITGDAHDGPQYENAVREAREKVKEAFSALVSDQKCTICNGASSIRSGPVESTCEKGHIFATCGASGLAIQEPGISRVCGVCRCRCLQIEELVKALPEQADFIRAEVRADVCMKCGGKFID